MADRLTDAEIAEAIADSAMYQVYPDNWIITGWGRGPEGWVELGHVEGLIVNPPAAFPELTIHGVADKLTELAARVVELEGVPHPLADLEAWLREDYARQMQMSVGYKNAAVLLSFSASDEDFLNKVVTTVIGSGPDLPSALAEALRKAKEERCFLHY